MKKLLYAIFLSLFIPTSIFAISVGWERLVTGSIHPFYADKVLIGATSTTTNSTLEVIGSSYFSATGTFNGNLILNGFKNGFLTVNDSGVVSTSTESDPQWVASSTDYLTTTDAASTYIPYTGAIDNLDLGTNNFLIGGYISLGSGNILLDQGGAGLFLIGQTAGINAVLNINSLTTSDKTFTFPNVSGTFALTSDILASSTWAKVANNLYDLQSTSTARTNLGLGTMALQPTTNYLATGTIGVTVQAYNANTALTNSTMTGLWNGTAIGYNYGGTGTTTILALQNLWWGDGTGKLVQVASSTLAGAAAGVSSLNGITGATILAGTANQITVASSSQTVTLSIPTSVVFTNASTTALSITGLKNGFLKADASGNISTSTLKFCFSLENASTTDDNVPIWTPDANITLKSQYCRVEGGTNVVGFTSDGTNVQESITCDADGQADDGTLTNATYSANERIEFDITSVSGTVTWLNWCNYYTVD